ncbi:hypothetical protein [Longimicrobium terrae]|uniref:hypothetical protein n=1 Tax=Longimicrobium terrae TaxID=1639882 RepID=UPI001611EDE6|nr:hypothetical protein [Longimicrobium terrae]MBB4634854.1 hypothetical protein [Longimicrobium terrae]
MEKLTAARRDALISKSLISLSTEYLFVLMPFIVILGFHLRKGTGLGPVLSVADWSFASAVLFGQTVTKLIAGFSATRRRNSPEKATLITALVLVMGLVPSLLILYQVLDSTKPGFALIITQLFYFALASLTFFVLGSSGQVILAQADESAARDGARESSQR